MDEESTGKNVENVPKVIISSTVKEESTGENVENSSTVISKPIR